MTRFIFITGGVVSSLGKGLVLGGARRAAAGARLQGAAAQARPVSECRSRHDEPVPARRSLRDRRRRRDRSRSRPLRALCRRRGAAQRQRHDGAHLFDRDRPRAARRISRRDGAGDPARHRCDQGIHHRRSRRRGFCAVRDRRHGRRHRKPAVSRGDPPARQRTRPRARDVRASDAGAVHRLGRRTEDQADAAFGQGTARARHPARYPAVPLRPADPGERPQEDRAVLQPARVARHPGDRCRYDLCRARLLSRRGVRPRGLRPFRACRRRSRTCRAGTRSSTASAGPRARSGSRSSASTRTCSTATNRWARR